MAEYSVYELLNKKRRGAPLASREIEFFVEGFTRGAIPEYQMSALLMAIAINGMTAEEMATLTQAMLRSGEQWHLRDSYDFIADKHSTGGVGDKVSLVLSPWVAACGVKIGMLSGRGLGHTGGTLDKLEAIPGFNARLSRDELRALRGRCRLRDLDLDRGDRARGQEDLCVARRDRNGRVACRSSRRRSCRRSWPWERRRSSSTSRPAAARSCASIRIRRRWRRVSSPRPRARERESRPSSPTWTARSVWPPATRTRSSRRSKC